MAATKTRKRTAAAKPKAAAKPRAAAKPAAKPKSRKGRTSPALKNRHRWTEDELASLAAQVNAAGYGQKQPIYEAVAKQIGNGITWQSVRAQFYAYEAQGKGASSGLSAAPALPADPIARVKAMVNRRGQVTREVERATNKLVELVETLESLKTQAANLTATIEAGNAEVTELDGKLGAIA